MGFGCHRKEGGISIRRLTKVRREGIDVTGAMDQGGERCTTSNGSNRTKGGPHVYPHGTKDTEKGWTTPYPAEPRSTFYLKRVKKAKGGILDDDL